MPIMHSHPCPTCLSCPFASTIHASPCPPTRPSPPQRPRRGVGRVAAAVFMSCLWQAFQPDKKEALHHFGALWWGNLMPNPRSLLDGCVRLAPPPDAHGRGRRPKVPDKLAFRAAAVFMKGWKDDYGQWHGFRNVPHAIELSKQFAELAAEADCCHATLLSSMRRVCPDIGRVRQTVKPTLSTKLKLQRRRDAGKLMALPRSVFNATEWCDEASFNFTKQDELVWGSRAGGERLVRDSRAPRSSGEGWLHFFITVNAQVGAHILVWLTGTKGLKNPGFKASTHLGSRARHVHPLQPRAACVAPPLKSAIAVMRVSAPHDEPEGGVCHTLIDGTWQWLAHAISCKVGNPQHSDACLPRGLHLAGIPSVLQWVWQPKHAAPVVLLSIHLNRNLISGK